MVILRKCLEIGVLIESVLSFIKGVLHLGFQDDLGFADCSVLWNEAGSVGAI